MFFNKNFKNENWYAYTVAICSGVVLFVVLSNLSKFLGWIGYFVDVISPIILGIVFAYIMQPICSLFEKSYFSRFANKHISRVASVAACVTAVILVFVVLLFALIPQLVDSLMSFASNFGTYASGLQDLLNQISDFGSKKGVDMSSIVAMGNDFVMDLVSSIPQRLNTVLTTSYTIGVNIANIALAFVLAIYFLLDMDNLLGGVKKVAEAFFSTKSYRTVENFLGRCNNILIRYIVCEIVDGFIVGFANFVFMSVLSMPYAVLVSVIVGVTNLAPTFGPIIGGVLGGLILLLVKPLDVLIFLLFTLIIQTLDGYLIKPKLFGSSLGVPAVWILITIIIGGSLFGVLGILLAIPFAAIMTYIYDDVIEKWLDERVLQKSNGENKIEKT